MSGGAVHIMLDIETLGVTPGSAIRSIGAVVFDPITGAFGPEFYRNVDRASCEAAGLVADPETLAWWSTQDQRAQDALLADPRALPQALADFAAFWDTSGASRLWAHAPDFDATLLSAAFRACNAKTPWRYSATRCTRTIYELAGVAPDRAAGVHHDALCDAKAQAAAVHLAFQRLGLCGSAGRLQQPGQEDVWRPEVRAFADLMERGLRANDHKPGWKGEDVWPLIERLHEEAEELECEFHKGSLTTLSAWRQRVGAEAADVANFAMMIADVSGALPLSVPPEKA